MGSVVALFVAVSIVVALFVAVSIVVAQLISESVVLLRIHLSPQPIVLTFSSLVQF